MPEVPVKEVLELQRKNRTHEQIVDELHQKGYNSQQIMDAINQTEAKEINPEPEYSDASLQLMGDQQELSNQEFPDITAPTPGMPQEPAYEQQPQFAQQPPLQQPQRRIEEQIEEIAEAIVDEKWEELTKDIGNITVWKESVQTEVESAKQEILRLEGRLEKLQQAIVAKVEDYNKTLGDVNTEMQALSKVFEKILHPLTTNIKDLSRITSELKKKK